MLQGRHPRSVWAFAAALSVAALLVTSITAVSAQSTQLAVSVDGFAAQNWSSAQAIVSVLGSDGKPLSGLTQQDFQAQVNGADASVTSVSRGVDSNVPISIVMAFDVSAAMQGAPLDQAKLAAHRFLDGLGPNDSVAVLSYGDSVNIVQPLTSDRAAAGSAIDLLAAGGSSSLYEGTTTSVLQAAASANTGRRAIVLLSASSDSGLTGSREQSLVAAKGLGVPAYVVGLGSAPDTQYLQDLTAAGGGQLMQTATADGLAQVYQNIGDLIRDQYVLTIDASALKLSATDAATLRIAVATATSSGDGERLVCPAKICASFQALQSGSKLKGTQTLIADVLASDKVTAVSLLVDGTLVQTANEAPYQFSLGTGSFAKGNHEIALAVKTSSGTTTLGKLSVEFSRSGGLGLSLIVVGSLLLMGAVAIAAVLFALRRRGQRGSTTPITPPPEPNEPKPLFIHRERRRGLEPEEGRPPPPIEAEPTLGYLTAVGGPLAGQVFSVGAKPVSIGSGHRCGIELPAEIDGSEVPSEYIRVWIRGDQLMVHEIRRLTAMGSVGGQWEILSDRDNFTIGSLVFKFTLEEPATEQASIEPVPNVLRDKPPEVASGSTNGAAAPVDRQVAEASMPASVIPLPTPPVAEPIPNILKERSQNGTEPANEEAGEQAASG
jgi:VWFA-related protein